MVGKDILVLNFSVCCLKVRMCENRCRREGRGGLPTDTVLREGRQAMGTRVRKEDTHFVEDSSKVIA